MKVIERSECVSCSGLLRDIHCVRDFPVYMGTTSQNEIKDLKVDMIFSECVKCGCIQMRNLIPLKVLYKDNHAAGSVGKTWMNHHENFANFALKHASGHVVEVGGAHLILANLIQESADIDSITVYDTNITGKSASKKVQTVESFFDSTTVKQKPDVIIHSHVIEHLYSPVDEIKQMSSLLKDGGIMLISAPVIDKMMEDGYTNAMNFEHTYGLSKALLYKILEHSQLRVSDEQDFSRHCVFVAARKDSQLVPSSDKLYDNSYFEKFVQHHKSEIKKINGLLASPQETFIFGAHIFTQFLLKNGLSESDFSCVLDNDVNKQGKRLYGTGLSVSSPKVLKNLKSPLVVLKAAQYTEEIKNDIVKNINPNTRFIL